MEGTARDSEEGRNGKRLERTGEKRGEQRGDGLADRAELWDRTNLYITRGETGRGPRVTAGGDVGRQVGVGAGGRSCIKEA